jgi:arsenate reductase (thioredoxin)
MYRLVADRPIDLPCTLGGAHTAQPPPRGEEVAAMKYVLFVCTHNAGRSQMAQALFERYAPDDVRGESAVSDPARQVWPEVVQTMRELGIDLSGNKPKRRSVEMQLHADWAVTMGCGDVCPYVPTTVDGWDIPDPAGRTIDEAREIRDLIDERVHELADDKIHAIRSHILSLAHKQTRECLREEHCVLV